MWTIPLNLHENKTKLEFLNIFRIDTRCTFDVQSISCISMYQHEQLENEMKETILLTIKPKRIKHTGITLTKEDQNQYTENYKTMRRKITEYLKKGREGPCSWVKRFNSVTMVTLPKSTGDSLRQASWAQINKLLPGLT